MPLRDWENLTMTSGPGTSGKGVSALLVLLVPCVPDLVAALVVNVSHAGSDRHRTVLPALLELVGAVC